MKKILYTFPFCFIFFICYSQNWTEIESIPVEGRAAPIAFTLNGKIYLGGGETNGTFENSFYMYEPSSNNWVAKSNLPDFISGAAYFTLNGKGYVVSGENSSSLINSVYEYDPVLDQWNSKTNFPGASRQNTFGFSIGDTGYIFGGFPGGTELNDLWAYNPNTDTWTQKASMPSNGRSGAGGFILNNIAYIGLGEYNSSSNYPSDIYAYNPVTDSWTIIAQYPGHVGNGPLGYTINNKGYLGLANYSDPNTNTVDFYHSIYQYDPSTDIWIQVDSFNGPGRSNAICQQIGDTVYIGSGMGLSQTLTDWWMNTSFTTAISNISLSSTKIYPNPCDAYFTIEMGNDINEVDITISDILGKIIWEKNILNPLRTITIERNQLGNTEGLLIVKVNSNIASKTFKLLAN